MKANTTEVNYEPNEHSAENFEKAAKERVSHQPVSGTVHRVYREGEYGTVFTLCSNHTKFVLSRYHPNYRLLKSRLVPHSKSVTLDLLSETLVWDITTVNVSAMSLGAATGTLAAVSLAGTLALPALPLALAGATIGVLVGNFFSQT